MSTRIHKLSRLTLPIVFFFIAVAHAHAAGLVPCGGAGEPQCDFTQFMTLVNTVIQFILFDLAIPIAAIMFAYAGFLMLGSSGNPGSIAKAKNIFLNVGLGLVIALAAWLIVETILTSLGFDGSWIGF